MRFFPASQLSPEMDCLKGRKWDEFLRSYKNPIERVIDSFPEKLEGNGLMYYMQFVSSANEYMDEFPQMYHELLAREQDFLFNAVVVIRKQSVDDTQVFSRQLFENSIGKPLEHCFFKYNNRFSSLKAAFF